MIKTTRRLKRYAYGDYMDKPYSNNPPIAGQYGTFNQDVNNALATQDLLPNNNQDIIRQQKAAVAKPNPQAQQNWNNVGNYANIAGKALSNNQQYNYDSSYIQERNKTKAASQTAIEGVGTAVPIVGGFMSLGAGVGESTMDEYGIYKDSTGQFIDQNLNVTTGVQGVFDTLKSDDLGAWVSQLTAGVSDIFGTKSASQQKAIKAKEDLLMRRKSQEISQRQNQLANYPTSGYGKYGMKLANGGDLPLPIDGSEVDQLASNVMLYEGDTHENGGITLDNNTEIEDSEVVKDDMVLSDRLKPTDSVKSYMKGLSIDIKSGDTYASLAERLGNKKGKFEEKLNSTRIGEANSAKLMSQRYDDAINILFEDQQMNKIQNNIGTYAYGGKLNPPEKDTQGKASSKELKWKDLPFNTYFQPNSEFYNQRKKDPNTGNTYVFDRADYERLGSYDNSLPADHPLNTPSGAKARAEFQKNPYAQQVVAGELNWNNFGKPGGTQYDILSIGTVDPTAEQLKLVQEQKDAKKYQILEEEKKRNAQSNDTRFGNTVPNQLFKTGGKFAYGDYFDRLEDNSGNIMNSIGFIANQAQINNLETDYTPELVKNPAFTYRDRTGFLRNEFGKQFTTASKGLNQSGSQDNIALKSNMYATTLNSLSGALDNESQRKDNLDAYYNQLANRTSAQNAQILNYNKEYGINARNNRRALTQQNTDSLIRGYMGNKSQKDLQQLDWDKAYIQALSSGNTGVAERLINDLPPEIRKRRFGNYDYKTKKG